MQVTVGDPTSFGRRLRQLREGAGLTQEQLAERAGISPGGVEALESGRRRSPCAHTVQALADALSLSNEEREDLSNAARGRAVRPDVSTPAQELALTHVPSPPTLLVGREREISEIWDLLHTGETRLVTLTGPGGVGKTRLAVEVATQPDQSLPDGVAFVVLAPIADPALVIPTVARSLGLVEAPGQPILGTVAHHLRHRRMLLVLDNFEQVIEASREVCELVMSCPELRVLVTSRAPLRVRGEQEYPVGPLDLPDLSRVPTPEDAARSNAVRLFVERAGAVAPAFELTRENTAAVAAVCRRLDGLPLAL